MQVSPFSSQVRPCVKFEVAASKHIQTKYDHSGLKGPHLMKTSIWGESRNQHSIVSGIIAVFVDSQLKPTSLSTEQGSKKASGERSARSLLYI